MHLQLQRAVKCRLEGLEVLLLAALVRVKELEVFESSERLLARDAHGRDRAAFPCLEGW